MGTNGILVKTYEPGSLKRGYIPPLTNNAIWTVQADSVEEKILTSRGKDSSYPGQWCDAIIFGGYVMEVHNTLNYNDTGSISGFVDYVNPWDNPLANTNMYLDLEAPLNRAYNDSNTTHFVSGDLFGQDETSTVPSEVRITPVVGGTKIDWYYNGNVIASDTIASHSISDFALAVQITGLGTISNYAYIWSENGQLWTSGSRGNNDVITKILNRGGVSSSELAQSVTGWQDPDNPDKQFILSYLYAIPGYATWIAGGRPGDTPTTALTDLVEKTSNYPDGLIGTDLIRYITDTQESSLAWAYLMEDPTSDGLTMNIPSEEHDYKIVWNYSTKHFSVYDDETFITETNALQFRTSPTVILISPDPSNRSRLGWCYTTMVGGVPQYTFYQWGIDESDTSTEEFDYSDAYFEYANGYDTSNPGEEDDPQPDADDMEDPSIDALVTGFVYAFDVNFSDMENLVSCLNGNTLASKIKADFGNKLFDFIVSYHTMPCITGATEGDRTGINYMGVPFIYGENDTQLTLKKISKSWYKVDLGTKKCLPTGRRNDNGFGFEDWQSAQVQMYLPFIGTVHLNTADVWGRDIHVVYYFDVLIGSCTVDIGVEGKGTLYSYESSCSYRIPFTSVIDTSVQQMMSGVMSASSGLFTSVMGASTGNAGAVLGGVNQIVGSAGNFISAMEHKAIVNRGGSLGSSGGWHTPRSPALIITVPDYQKVDTTLYNQINGYPTHKAVQLSNYSGQYVEVAHIDLKASVNGNGATPNDSELDMIRSLLNGGVYV